MLLICLSGAEFVVGHVTRTVPHHRLSVEGVSEPEVNFLALTVSITVVGNLMLARDPDAKGSHHISTSAFHQILETKNLPRVLVMDSIDSTGDSHLSLVGYQKSGSLWSVLAGHKLSTGKTTRQSE